MTTALLICVVRCCLLRRRADKTKSMPHAAAALCFVGRLHKSDQAPSPNRTSGILQLAASQLNPSPIRSCTFTNPNLSARSVPTGEV
ncbi:hypothetical protein NDU88_008024 [Pleurodeles waltl]|uniref:Secreted protein n=1 Tax=Pleurodeles waltl TaxID=8319 RepID=A0AAV7RWG4_PLEWA|nr:hypothetical protein NDU88_008024 [Pleurodeles waltl]